MISQFATVSLKKERLDTAESNLSNLIRRSHKCVCVDAI